MSDIDNPPPADALVDANGELWWALDHELEGTLVNADDDPWLEGFHPPILGPAREHAVRCFWCEQIVPLTKTGLIERHQADRRGVVCTCPYSGRPANRAQPS